MADLTPHQRETQLADDYLSGAQLAREVSHHALQQALRDAKAGELRDPAKTAMNAAITSGTLLDKRLLLEGRPTQITAHEDPKREAQALARRLGVALETTATDLPPAPELPATSSASSNAVPLTAESRPAKRARAREAAPVQTASD